MIRRSTVDELGDTMPVLAPNGQPHEPNPRRVDPRSQRASLAPLPAGDSGRAVNGTPPPEQSGQPQPPGGPRPEELAMRRFSRRLWGVHPGEVRDALIEIAAALDRSQSALAREVLQRRALERSLETASATIQELQQQLIAAKAELSAGQDREGALARDLLASTQARSPSRQVTEAQAEETLGIARQAANAIMETARAAALEVLRSARSAAHAVRRSVDIVVVTDRRPAEYRVSDPSNRAAIVLQRTARAVPR